MKRSDFQEKALQRAAAEIERRKLHGTGPETRHGGPPVPGDLYVFRETADYDVQWAVLETDPGAGRALVVAADLDREVGSCDVAIHANGGALTLRCRFGVWLPETAFEAQLHTGRLDEEALGRARRKREAVELGIARGTYGERETDEDRFYRDLLDDLAEARDALGGGVAGATAVPEATSEIRLSGIDAATGQYLVPALMFGDALERMRAEVVDRFLLELLRGVYRLHGRPTLGPLHGTAAADLARAGWALVLPAEKAREARRALEPLLEHRRRHAPVKVLEVRRGDDWREWLARHGVEAGEEVAAEKVPYYLLLVGPPTRISYTFQNALAVRHAVGRLCFDDPNDYRRYAESLVRAETGSAPPPARRAIFFAPRHAGDPVTRATADFLASPLAAELESGWGIEAVRLLGSAATRSRLAAALAGDDRGSGPALLVAAAHGLGRRPGDPEQGASQGTLVCQDWPGAGPVEPDQVFAARDVTDGARVHGGIAFVFASFGAGTPEYDELLREPGGEAPRLADRPFVARLPQRLLAHPAGGALAVVGLAGRAWGYTLTTEPGATEPGEQRRPIRQLLGALLEGQPVGLAVGELNRRAAAYASKLAELLRKADCGARVDEREMATTWVERNHLQSYTVLGDPAARLRTR